jgi:hypothetical protein
MNESIPVAGGGEKRFFRLPSGVDGDILPHTSYGKEWMKRKPVVTCDQILEGLHSNTLKTALFMTVLTLLLVLAGNALGGQSGMVITLGMALVASFGAYWLSDRMVLAMFRAQCPLGKRAPRVTRPPTRVKKSRCARLPKGYQQGLLLELCQLDTHNGRETTISDRVRFTGVRQVVLFLPWGGMRWIPNARGGNEKDGTMAWKGCG